MESSHQQLTSTNLFDVKDLVVVVTGGGTGIGQMMTRALIANGARKVYIVGRRLDVLETTASEYASSAPGKIIPYQADLSSKSQIDGLRKKLEAEEKYIDILINNSAIGGPQFDGSVKTVEEISESMWSADEAEANDLLQTNMLGYFYTSAALLKLLGNSKNFPQIINISSNASFARQAMVGILYSMSKAAITHLTKILATHLSSTNVRVNAIAPGLFPSELTTGCSDQQNKSALKDTMGLKIPEGRPGIDKEIACTVLFLASKHQQYTSGSVVLVDGGVLNLMPSSY
ncbi:hypothetical protein PCANC_05665 [Puccinia coronata f. sp. avenae]|uniref:Uncharacterized protein n=1 Tax=Puccinia coronata f. sp. avenae TaxID=200324 RepID=A0A2N5T416_9BASI|nr:hypothetical protein PCASD_18330 [Puccinia coronata f. sp. avenae]PLW34452.1 hypothetical protein PCASD_15174 [Puccinia coronata f. sp. avenae]PLW54839.1 hypothetical protein PCANC_05665 [Puccinia coronata f. sp. avenae]